ncbi:hypothetical protein ACLBX9_11790 [Methylobacterium sp. A49B]|jgi:hypothetical protein|uniref:Uncharacterized protein n=1 Tax=Methylobacterium mesophilicum SR1.6/6 TaxID=908290 RepID=A0A6B9FIS1_9HYPH|nr:hypothetical protein [Methylobacterium mesophilicum]QGY00798.1 hypothetical protein MMSR116_01890 [Methylobacterium mesophilicum SR1.6/6]
MRAASRALLALALALPAGAASAQVQQNDPNAANASFALQSQIRTLNQQRVTDFNTLNQTIQRNVQFDPYGYGPYVPYRGVRVGRHVGRHGIARRGGGGVNTSVCIGC